MAAPKVFVSYAHESGQHQNDVLAFATFLRGQGVDAVLDLWSADARHDWFAWAMHEMTTAAYVIVVASPAYRAVGDGNGPADRNRGVQSEATLLRDLVYGDRATWTPKVLPVLLPGHEIDEIPLFLSPYTTSRFTVAANTVAGAEELLRVIHRSPGHVAPPVLRAPELPPKPAPASVVWCAGMPVDADPDAIEIHLVPGEEMTPHSPEDLRRALSSLVAEVRLDESGSSAWSGGESSGMAVLSVGQRSAWVAPTRHLDANRVAALAADYAVQLLEFGLAQPATWVLAIRAGSARVVLPPLPSQDLSAAEVAARLVDELRAKLAPEPTSASRVTNTITGNVSGVVIQAGDIQGGLHF